MKNIYLVNYNDNAIDRDFNEAFESLEEAVKYVVEIALEEGGRYLEEKEVLKEAKERNKKGFVYPFVEEEENGFAIQRIAFHNKK